MSREPDTDGLVLREAGPADDAGLRRLNELAFPNNPKARADLTRGQYWDNPFGPTVALVWDDDGEVVAQYVACCVPGRLGGRDATLTIGIDAAVHPDHRGRRLFTPLSNALYERVTQLDRPLIAYPNEQSVRAIARAGWTEVANLRVRVLPMDPGWFSERFHLPRGMIAAATKVVTMRPGRAGARRSHDVALEDDPLGAVDEIWPRVAATQPWSIAKHAGWWRWRYLDHPDRPYRFLVARRNGQPRAVTAVRTREDLGGRFHCLLELLADEPAAATAVVRAVADGALGPADGVALTAAPGSASDRLAARAGMLAPPSRLLERPIHFGVVPHPTLVPDPTAVSWSTTWGDLDHV
jgi:GNAT superfamily N-acetyltransferase